MVNVGTQPTIGDQRPQRIEAHLIDWQGNAYDRPMRLAWVRRLRGEQSFASLDHLQAQLREDKDAALTVLDAIPDIETDDSFGACRINAACISFPLLFPLPSPLPCPFSL